MPGSTVKIEVDRKFFISQLKKLQPDFDREPNVQDAITKLVIELEKII